jgi:hypothetical protein
MEDMGSAGETGIVMENGGLRDLNVIWIVLGANQAETPQARGQYTMRVENERSDAPEDGCTSSFFSSGGGGTWSWISTCWQRGGDDVRFAVLETIDRSDRYSPERRGLSLAFSLVVLGSHRGT